MGGSTDTLDRKKQQSIYVKNQRAQPKGARCVKSNQVIQSIDRTHSLFSKQMFKMAKKTFADRMGRAKNKHKHVDNEDLLHELSRCNSYDFDLALKEAEAVYVREKHFVPIETIQLGMGRFSFLLDTCTPGSVPDPLLVAALLDLVSASNCSDDFLVLLQSVNCSV